MRSEAHRLADIIEQDPTTTWGYREASHAAAAELRRLHHNNQVLKDALWKACGDDEEAVNATIESQGELK
jgi:hypothetical protein